MIPYIIKAAVILAGCLAFYKVIIRRETFYKMNRYVLITCLIISFALPLVPVPQQLSMRKTQKEVPVILQKNWPITEEKQATVGSKQLAVDTKEKTAQSPTAPIPNSKSQTPTESGISWSQAITWLFWIYWFGVAVFAFSFLFQIIVLLWRIKLYPMIRDGRYRIIEVSGDKAPCSFGNYIFINPSKYDWDTYNQILQHEKIHIRQNHSLDILFAELVLIFQWFNPFAWIYRREVESNLEFLTDDQLMLEKIDKESYQLSLLKVSAPHFPLSLTTNYNQSILKKRIAMMNSKKSSMHTAWKYLFLLPVIALFASLLNEPKAQRNSGPKVADKIEEKQKPIMENEGYWFATIKDDKVKIMFSDEELKDDNESWHGHHSFSSTTFKLSDLSSVPRGTAGTFSVTREAGKMEFTGKFEENTGMGKYKFIADKAYAAHMNAELTDKLDEDDQLAFFFIDIKKEYVAMLKKEGYTKLEKDEVIPLAALNVDAPFIRSMKSSFKDVDVDKLVTLKALNIDEKYIKEIRSTGLKEVDADQIVSFKAQNIDKDYIEKVRKVKGKDGDDDADDIVSFKAMDITDEYINSFKAVGMTDLSKDELVSMKAVGVTPDYVKSMRGIFKDLDPEDLVGMKSLGVTPEYVKSVKDMGFTDVKPDNLTAMKAQDITPEFIKSFEAIGYKNLELDEVISLKALNITPDFVKGFEAIGFKNIKIDELTGLKAMNVTPEYITTMKGKGFNYTKLEKYITLKSIDE